ncbi:hypothetical protein O0544_12870 [Edwardsiella anguillarum]|nr:hypothetical protein [Edwardsiella anguillarum]MDA6077032.1 hypothetical protein [Edwardsiella anguillarum]WHQ15930.1 hypothetical protein MQ083_03205 [Edwardsiella anguillarum]
MGNAGDSVLTTARSCKTAIENNSMGLSQSF